MVTRHIQYQDIPGIVSLLSLTMPWAPTKPQDIAARLEHCPQGQCVVTDKFGRVIGYGFILRTRAGLIQGEWYADTGLGVAENHLEHGNVAYVGSTAWHPSTPIVVRSLVDWYRTTAEQWRVKQIHGFSRVPSLADYGSSLRLGDVHDIVLDGLDPLTRVYRKLGFEPAVPQPNYSIIDRESAGFGMLMVDST